MTNKGAGKLFFQAILLLILLFGLVRLVMVKEGLVVILELLVLLFLLILSVVGLATYKNSESKLLFAVFLLYASNLLLLWGVYKSLYLVLFLVSLLGLGVSLPSKSKETAEEPVKPSAPPQKVVDGKISEVRESALTPAKARGLKKKRYLKQLTSSAKGKENNSSKSNDELSDKAKITETKLESTKEPKEKAPAVKTTFTPGKYVASKRSNVYHEPKCEWAKKIQKDRQVWFESREEALNKGYKKHSCVESS